MDGRKEVHSHCCFMLKNSVLVVDHMWFWVRNLSQWSLTCDRRPKKYFQCKITCDLPPKIHLQKKITSDQGPKIWKQTKSPVIWDQKFIDKNRSHLIWYQKFILKGKSHVIRYWKSANGGRSHVHSDSWFSPCFTSEKKEFRQDNSSLFLLRSMAN